MGLMAATSSSAANAWGTYGVRRIVRRAFQHGRSFGPDFGQVDPLAGQAHLLLRRQEHRRAKALGQVEGLDGQRVALGHVLGREDDDRQPAGRSPAHELDIAVGALGGRAGGRTLSLHVDDDQGRLAHDGQADVLGVEAEARPRSGRHGLVAGHRGRDAHADGRDLVFTLHGDATHLGQFPHHAGQDGGRRRDGVAREEAAPGIDRRPDNGIVALEELDHLCNTLPDVWRSPPCCSARTIRRPVGRQHRP